VTLTGGFPLAPCRPGWLCSLVHHLRALAGIGIAIGALTACGVSTELPKESAQEAVLLRLVATRTDGTPIDLFGLFGRVGDFLVLAENIDTGEQMYFSESGLPPEAAREGWMFLFLATGRYEVIVKPAPDRPASRRFFLAVPAARAVIYGGSLTFTCESGWWKGSRCRPPSEVTDESELAAKIANTMPQEYGPLVTSLLR